MKTSLRNLALLITLVTQVTVSLPSSFFPRFVKQQYGAPDPTIGFIFAAYPLAQVLSTPLWTFSAKQTSRTLRFVFGLVLSAVGVLLFAFADNIPMFAASRFIQGVAAQGLLSCSLALIMQVSDNVQRDVGLEEFFVGVGYMLGPSMGGILFEYLGFAWAFIPLSILYLCLVVPVPLLLGTLRSEINEDRGEYSLLASSARTQELEGHDAQGEIGDETESNKPSWRDCISVPVGVLVLVAVVHAAAQSFKEVVLARHMHLGMSANAAVSGTAFMTEPILYSLASFGVGTITSISRKQQICLGLLVYALGFFMISNPPVFVEPGTVPAHGLPLSRGTEWVVTLGGLSLMGTGSAFMLVPIVPAMLHCWIAEHTPAGLASSAHPDDAGGALSVPEEIEDTISGIYSSSWSLGELIGPPLGGFMLQHLPKTREINCVLAAAACSWAYFPAMLVFVVVLCTAPVVVAVALRGHELCDSLNRRQSTQEPAPCRPPAR